LRACRLAPLAWQPFDEGNKLVESVAHRGRGPELTH
jgi:hypothetical protein